MLKVLPNIVTLLIISLIRGQKDFVSHDIVVLAILTEIS